ncbi:hypothetical protein bthur0011_28620 [Bacillus thuringiensis serovar huazhongensis BGSC 4BD1]|nr:hypothetical protein bthur0011_28620 [Bacillus thuringiensis serovar huazhongensis BGSC 4BD1]
MTKLGGDVHKTDNIIRILRKEKKFSKEDVVNSLGITVD